MNRDGCLNIAVVGTGYVGLTTGACFAEVGHNVICHDISTDKIEKLKRGEIPFFETGLGEIVRRNLTAGRLRFTTDGVEAVRSSYLIFIAVGTPPGEDGSADLEYVRVAAKQIGRAMDGERVVIAKSTVPVGTSQLVRETIEAETGHPVHVCSNPEFLKQGTAVSDFMKPDRVVVGVEDSEVGELLRDLYAPFLRTGADFLVMDMASAEIAKYAANVMLAARISLMNTIANLCEQTGADVNLVRRALGSDPRIGPTFLFPGVGYGGSCFPKDVKALAETMEEMGLPAGILHATDSVNEHQKQALLKHLLDRFGDSLGGKTFGVWGLSFKPNTDDMREAPSLVTITGLLERGARVVVHDPMALHRAESILGASVEYREREYEVLADAEALIIHTEWLLYRHPDFEEIRKALRQPVIFDGRNLYDPAQMAELGFEYYSIGRRPVLPVVHGDVARPEIASSVRPKTQVASRGRHLIAGAD